MFQIKCSVSIEIKKQNCFALFMLTPITYFGFLFQYRIFSTLTDYIYKELRTEYWFCRFCIFPFHCHLHGQIKINSLMYSCQFCKWLIIDLFKYVHLLIESIALAYAAFFFWLMLHCCHIFWCSMFFFFPFWKSISEF